MLGAPCSRPHTPPAAPHSFHKAPAWLQLSLGALPQGILAAPWVFCRGAVGSLSISSLPPEQKFPSPPPLSPALTI